MPTFRNAASGSGATGAVNLDSTTSTATTGSQIFEGGVTVKDTLYVAGNITAVGGLLTLGDSDTDSINLTADIASNIRPDADNTYSIGVSGSAWSKAWLKAADLGGGTIQNLGAPANATDAATKDYVDTSSGGAILNIVDGSSNTQAIQLASDTLTFQGTTNETEVVVGATDTVTIGLPSTVAITTEISSPTYKINGSGANDSHITSTSNTLSTTTQTALDTFAVASFRASEYFIGVTQGSDIQTSKVMVAHDGTNAYITQYGTLVSGGTLATFTADVNSGNVRLLITMAAATAAQIKVIRQTVNV
tara:strand:+ start:90 stop:1007 length:918 start_codon:yes stop_codon:yes gene_type:complete